MLWYENIYRRHLCDMHIEDWDDDFLSEFSPEAYYKNLVIAQVEATIIYVQSHVGYCYYPTKIGYMHKAFINDEGKMRRLVTLCKQGGIKVVLYYTLHYNNWAHDNYPEWRMIKADGSSWREKNGRYGLCCPSNSEYREFVMSQLREISEYFVFEGMFLDMPFWPYPCHCKSCQERFAQEDGGEIPDGEDVLRWNVFLRARERWMGEFASSINQEIKRLTPNTSVVFNLAGACTSVNRGVTEKVNDACDYTSGDLYGGILEQSFVCKFYRNITRNQPFEYMTSRCNPDLLAHTITKSSDQLELTTFLTYAHHGACLLIDAIDPIGTMDIRVYKRMGKVFEKAKMYEPYLQGEMVEDIGIYYSMTSRENHQKQDFDNRSCSINAAKTMIEANIPVGVISNYNLNDLSKYKVLVLSNPCNLTSEAIDKIISYVSEGGGLYFSNCDEKRLINTLIGGSLEGYTREKCNYIAPKEQYESIFEWFNEKYPLPIRCRFPKIIGVPDENVIAYITRPYTVPGKKFASIHSDPPGIQTEYPALVYTNYGKGKVIWSAAPLEYQRIQDYKDIFIRLLDLLSGHNYTILSDMPKQVEIITFGTAQSMWVSLVNLNERDNQIPLIDSHEIKVKVNKTVEEVVLLPERNQISFYIDNEYVVFKTRPLHIFDMYEITIS